MRHLLRGLVLLLAASSPLPAASTETERLVAVGRLWGQIRYFHPWLRYRPIDWDAALIQALPRIRRAATDDEFAAAVGELLAAIDDSQTRVEKAPAAGKTDATPPALYRSEGQVLVVTLAAAPRAAQAGWSAFWRPLANELANATAVLVDARLGTSDAGEVGWLLGLFDEQLVPREVAAPASRAVLLNGYPPQTGSTSGGYYQGFVVTPGDRYTPEKEALHRRTVFLVEPRWVPEVALTMAAAGQCAIVSTGPLGDPARTTSHALPGGWRALVRVTETLGGPVEADLVPSDGRDPFQVALALAAEPSARIRPATTRAAGAPPSPEWRPDARYETMTDPDAAYRLLAVYRLWNAIHYFYPYLDLLADWDAALAEFVPRALQAEGGQAYALMIAEMAARIEDGHTGVRGHPALGELQGWAAPPFEVALVEEQPAVVKIVDADAAQSAGVRLGDVIVAVEGEPAEAKMSRLSPWVTASTPEAKRQRLAMRLLRGASDTTLAAVVRGGDGAERPVVLRLSTTWQAEGQPGPPAYRALSPEIGYADLTRLVPAEVDGMFTAFKHTSGLILDMRGYPKGTAWSIAPRINVKRAKIGARFRRPLWTGFDLLDGDVAGSASYAFEQPLPPATGELYRGRTVMLIDGRAISQSEHSGLFFEAAADTVFIGTPTAGANGDVTRLTLPGGIEVSFTGHDVRHADGRQLQRVGLQPRIRAAPTLAGLRAGRDEVLDRAIQYLTTGE